MARAAYSSPLPRPPRIACTPPGNERSPTIADATLVALESSTYSTPSARPTSSSRCATPAKPCSAARTAAGSIPRASVTAAAASAFSRLWAPRSRMSATAITGSPRHVRCPSRTAASARPSAPPAPGGSNRTAAARSGTSSPSGRTATSPAPLVGEHAQLGLAVGGERAVPVEVVGGEVEQDGGLRGEGERVLELERRRLADHDRSGVERAGEAGQRRADVAGDRDREPRLAVDPTDQLGGRRLAVGPRDGDHLVGHQPPAQLELAQHGQPALARRADHRRLLRDARALDHRRRAVEQRDAVGRRVRGHPRLRERRQGARVDRARVATHNGLPARPEQLGRRAPGAGEADDEERACGQRRTRGHAGIQAGAALGGPWRTVGAFGIGR